MHNAGKYPGLLVIPLVLLGACRSDSTFRSNTAGDSPFKPHRAAVESNPSIGESTLALPCGDGSVTVPNVARIANMTIPVSCALVESTTTTATTLPNMDLVFVLDASGSMQPYVQMIRSSIRKIADAAQRGGYKVYLGVITFSDSILDTQGLTDRADDLLNVANAIWKPLEARGGMAPEVGLGAVERGLEILARGSSPSKTLVYFSDGPAKRESGTRDALAESFAVGETAKKLHSFSGLVQGQRGMFRLLSGTACTRGDSWFAEWPTPCEQFMSLTQSAGVRHLPLPFPMADSPSYEHEFVARLETAAAAISTDCKIESIEITRAENGEKLLPETKVSASGGMGVWTVPVDKLPTGSFLANVSRQCKTRSTTDKISITVL